jgi:FkbM family methyltransferase
MRLELRPMVNNTLRKIGRAEHPGTKTGAETMQATTVEARTTHLFPVPAETPELDYFVAANEYGFYCVPRAYAKREVPTLLANGKVYEPDTLNFMRRMVGDGDIISGGAFVGDFFPALSEVLSPRALLHSFEPNPLSFMAASKTIALNRLNNIRLHAVAVGDKPGTLPLLVSRSAAGEAMAARTKIIERPRDGATIEVEVRKLDDLIAAKRRVALLQLDIEGFEGPALLGCKRIIARNAPVILLEAEGPYKQRAYLKTLQKLFPRLGYRRAGVIERNCIYLADG